VSEICDAYAGIDVAFARAKRLPVSILLREPSGRLGILPLRRGFEKPPAGRGNVAALDPQVRREFAEEVLAWLRRIEETFQLRIRRVAIDAPSDYCRDASNRRAAERCLDGRGISCFATPTEAMFESKVAQSREFLAAGGPASRLPNANQIWMLVGFQLFRTLEARYECIETYPQAIVRQLQCGAEHKSTQAGLDTQREAAAGILDLQPSELRAKLGQMGFGAPHDQLDALLSAWVASLRGRQCEAFGTPPLDAIWVPSATWMEPDA
jgi:predicted nuclease with RNAse H fold